jgi:hypothetical protein
MLLCVDLFSHMCVCVSALSYTCFSLNCHCCRFCALKILEKGKVVKLKQVRERLACRMSACWL